MKGKEQYKKLLIFILSLLLWFGLTALWAVAWYEFFSKATWGGPFYRKGNWLVIAIYGFMLLIFNFTYGGYRVGYYKRGDIIFSGFLATVFTNALTYLQVSLMARKFLNLYLFLALTAIDFILIWVWATASNKLYNRLYPPHRMLVVYGGRGLAESLICKMSTRSEKYRICEAIHIDDGYDRIISRIGEYEAVVLCDIHSELRNQILKHCFKNQIRVYVTPKIADIIIRGASTINLFDSPLLLCRNMGLSGTQKMVKRMMDLAISGLGLVVLSPVMLLVAAAIKLEDGGPVFYCQQRLTLGGRVFNIYKFRSMIVDAEKDGIRLASKSDKRITRVGRFIRKTRLDEIPQLINIFKGEMSVVGPRPERPEIADQYTKNMPEFPYRLKVKAGLTGYAQVVGKYNTTPYDKLKLDLMYISEYSILTDIKLILMTIKVIFTPNSTEGVAKEQKTADTASRR